VDAATRSALLDFSYHLAAGSLEEAFRAVRGVRSRAVWRSMAHLAIRSKRLDIAGEWVGAPEGWLGQDPATLATGSLDEAAACSRLPTGVAAIPWQ
jgi:hypothetical protein